MFRSCPVVPTGKTPLVVPNPPAILVAVVVPTATLPHINQVPGLTVILRILVVTALLMKGPDATATELW